MTSIGNYAFERCSGLTGSLTISNFVTSIGGSAFYECSGLNGTLTIGSSVTSIGGSAFAYCSGLTGSLTIGSSVTSIGKKAFEYCSGFTGSLTIGNSVTSIGNSAFEGCSGLTGSLIIPNSVTSIGKGAFYECSGFNGSLTIGNAVTSIGTMAFNGCSGFTGTLAIGSSVTSIDNYAFFGCSGITHIIAKPAAPPTLGTGVFEGVTGLQSITVPCDKSGAYSSWSGYAAITEDFVYDLTVASASTELGSASITQQPDCGNPQATVTATPYEGVRFINWTENGAEVSTDNPYTFTLTSDRNLVANFTTTDQYDFTAICATGQKLYYRIIDAEQNFVSIVAPNSDNYLDSYNGYTRPIGNISLPETVSNNEISYTVKKIGAGAFYQCNGLTGTLTIPNNVTSIGVSAFEDCSGFTGSLTIPNNVISIGRGAFAGCSGFTGSLTIGSSVESIGDGAFYECSGFTGSLTIPNSVTSIGIYAISGCSGFTGSLTIGSSVESIGVRAFDHCSGFTGSLTIPNSVTSIGEYAFGFCSGFTGSLTIPNSVTSIEDYTFNECSGFTGSLTIGSSVISIGEGAFAGCSGFTGSLTIGSSVESIGEWAFNECSGFTGSLIIPISVTSIGEGAFADCSGFTNIIAKRATPPTLGITLGIYAFDGMTNLETITVPCGKDGVYKTTTGWSNFARIIEDGIVYDLTVASANPAFGSASITQQATCENNQVTTVSATPNNGYRFVNWTENGVQVSTENQYSFTLESDRNLVANFGMQYDFSATCETGQTLYYRIIDAEQHWVSIVPPNSDNANGWYGFDKPTGDIMLPETVEHDRASYTVTEINSYAFNNCYGLTGSLDIPNSVTSIGEYAFFSCSGFTGSLTIPNSVNSIGIYAFIHCSGFTGSLTIPNSITRIEESAFCNCSGFTGTLTIGSSVNSIGNYAFERCSGFTNIIAKPAAPPTLGNYAFDDMTKLETITVPCNKEGFYKDATGWRSFTSKIEDGIVHDLTVASANPAFGSASITQQATCENPQVTLTATPIDGYRFVKWTENGEEVSTANTYTFNLESDRNLVANFTITDQYNFTAICATGQKLYYRIIDAEKLWVMIVAPNSDDPPVCYEGYARPIGNISLPETVSHNETNYTVTAIGPSAFFCCNGLTGSLTIPNSVTSIEGDAFCGCTGFTGSLTIGGSVTSIGEGAFADCSNFTGSLTIPNSVTSIGVCAFEDCPGFTGSLTIPSNVTSIEEGTFAGCKGFTGSLTIPNSVTSIGYGAFYKCLGLNGSLTIPNAVESIGEYAFYGCSGFTGSLSIPNSVTNIGNDAFEGCKGFTGSLTIGNSVTSIGGYAFCGCTGFTGSLTIGSSVESIGEYAFYECWNFTGSLTIPNSVTSIGEGAFADCSGFTGSLTIGNSVTSIGEGAFANCLYLNGSLNIPNSVTNIGNYAFGFCFSFTGSLIIPNSVTSIGGGAFYVCSGLTGSLTIGNSVTSIGDDAFDGCEFANIISKAQTPPNIGSYIPDASKNVYVPAGKAVSYEEAWNTGLSEEDKYHFIESDGSTCRFVGTSSNAWSNASNWENGKMATENTPNTFINADCELDVEASVGSVTVAAGKTLTVNEDYTLTADGFILENGAQLINNGAVDCNYLAVKKAIAGYGTDTGGWHLVSSPVGKIGIPSGMRTNPEENYDLYRFDQTGDGDGNEWINAKFVESHGSDFFLDNQSGYLYANKNNTTIVFSGVFADTGAKTLEYVEGVDFAGFNLVGNPFPCNATISGTGLRSSNYFYKMNTDGTNLEIVVNPILAPCTGVFAVAASDQATVTFAQTSATANVTRSEKNSLQDIRVELLANGKVIDRAFLNMNGESLPKFRLQDKASEICFYQNKEELAVASTDATRGEMPLNFKAEKNGSYTISVNTENVDAEYLHLIDNLTGNDVDLLGSEGDVARNVSTYTFDARTSDYASRFKLVFGVKDEASAGSVSESFAYISNGEIVISNEGRATLQIIDVLGRIVSSEEINGESRISTNGLTAGLYILNLNGLTQKIVVE